MPNLRRHLFAALLGAAATAFAQGPAAPRPATAAASAPKTPFASLVGRWVRPDGGYVITIRAVDAAGKLDAGYANPGPLPFYSAEATRDGTQTRLFFELRAGGYSGSTYRLTYDAAADRLIGVYYQAVARQSYDVQFERAK
ncbi:MAG: hypothetical protein KA151_03240 [Piscinibacter sp.]|nr:hypothetical protein [Piscinibacter sp.]